MTDPQLMATIAAMRDIEADYQTKPRRQEWTAADIQELTGGNPEVERLARQNRIGVMYATSAPSTQTPYSP